MQKKLRSGDNVEHILEQATETGPATSGLERWGNYFIASYLIEKTLRNTDH
jgi:hypothetical protein